MTVGSDNPFPSILFEEHVDPATPPAGHWRLFVDTDNILKLIDEAGTVTAVGGSAVTRASLGLDTTDSPQFAGVNVGHASDTTLTRASAGVLNVEGNRIFAVGGADVPIADGGTGASTASAAFNALSPMTTSGDIIYGGASGAGTRLAKGSDGQVLTLASGLPSWATGGGGGVAVPPAPLQTAFNFSSTNPAATFGSTPVSTSLLFALFGSVSTARTVSSIAQTNVTWTSLHGNINGTSANVELWKGVPSGTPGTTVTATMSGASSNTDMCVMEFATGHGLAGTLDTSADVDSALTYQNTGVIVPSAANALVFCLFADSNGTILMMAPSGPWYVPAAGSGFSSFGYWWPQAKHPMRASIPSQTSAASANTIISVI